MLHFDGGDSDYLYFSNCSWSGSGGEYTITISKRDGVIHCTCPDAVCRLKNRFCYDDPKGIYCKHQRGVIRWIAQRLETA